MKKIKNSGGTIGNNKLLDEVTEAMALFQRNTVSPLIMVITGLIQNSLKDVSKRIAETVDFVHKLAIKKNENCPFQYDAG